MLFYSLSFFRFVLVRLGDCNFGVAAGLGDVVESVVAGSLALGEDGIYALEDGGVVLDDIFFPESCDWRLRSGNSL